MVHMSENIRMNGFPAPITPESRNEIEPPVKSEFSDPPQVTQVSVTAWTWVVPVTWNPSPQPDISWAPTNPQSRNSVYHCVLLEYEPPSTEFGGSTGVLP